MKLLLFEWNAYMQHDLESSLTDLSISFDRFSYNFRDKHHDDYFEILFQKALNSASYDAVISFNYFPLVAKITYQQNIKYIAWSYDSPTKLLTEPYVNNPNNFIFIFDKIEANEYISAGIETVYHLPLAVYPKRLNSLKKSKDIIDRYSCDCSFVGNLHSGNYEHFLSVLPTCEQDFSDDLLASQFRQSGVAITESLDIDSILARWNPYFQRANSNPNYHITQDDFKFLFGQYATKMERLKLIESLSSQCNMHVYSSDFSMLPQGITYRGTADYYLEMPYIFRYSKLNLNPTFKRIRSGISLRALDIMACGGVLFANAQPELLEYFEPMKDFVCYESVEVAPDLARYILCNDSLRESIRITGMQKCQELFSYEIQLKKIFKISELL